MVTRRSFLGGLLAVAGASSLVERSAHATIVRAVPLGELLYESKHVVLGTTVDSFAQWERVGNRRCIVTYSLFRVEQPLGGATPTSEVMIQTLGGTVGDLGQVFHGEAVVALKERATVFLRTRGRDLFSVTEMYQGYYPVRPDAAGVQRLNASVSAAQVLDNPLAATRRLHGRTLTEAEELLAKEPLLAH